MSDKAKQMLQKSGISTFVGKVISDKMDKTVVVEVTRLFKHPVYGKVVKRTKNFKVHDEGNAAIVGDVVEFKECRPISKSKHATLIKVLPKS
ncbi:MAG: 30S ribosomal protein S17 [candidate division TM6 bacterium GW2011_GWF2_37_49]|nr:MAG: 30S ribosomal protein S17 [candidate division TM6 bacterium GW2011_GWF2_37_49]